jgi:hypothetical protein
MPFYLSRACKSDEILNGKTLDRNSNYFPRYCFENGIELYLISLSPFSDTGGHGRKRIEVIPDEEYEVYVCTLPSAFAWKT